MWMEARTLKNVNARQQNKYNFSGKRGDWETKSDHLSCFCVFMLLSVAVLLFRIRADVQVNSTTPSLSTICNVCEIKLAVARALFTQNSLYLDKRQDMKRSCGLAHDGGLGACRWFFGNRIKLRVCRTFPATRKFVLTTHREQHSSSRARLGKKVAGIFWQTKAASLQTRHEFGGVEMCWRIREILNENGPIRGCCWVYSSYLR